MAFIAKNPILAPRIESQPINPPEGCRGLYPTNDGWYDIDDNGSTERLATKQEIEQNISQLDNDLAENIEITNKNTQKLGGLSFSISESGILTITKGD